MRKFRALLVKELRELLTPQIILPFVVTVLVFVMIGNIVGQESEQSAAAALIIVDFDGSAQAGTIVTALEQAGFEIDLRRAEGVPESDLERIVEEERTRSGAGLALGIPAGFGAGVVSGSPRMLTSYAVMRDFSFFATRDAGALKGAIETVNQTLSDELITGALPGADPVALKEPVALDEHVIVGERSARASAEEVVGFITSQTTFIPIVLFIVIIFAAQMIAVAIASEKENKTLETLLSAPIGRGALVTAKMVAAGIVALMSAAFYLVGMRYYMDAMTRSLGEEARAGMASSAVMQRLGLTLGVQDYALLGLTLFMGILVALGIAIILGAFAENVKAVQSLLTPLIVFIMIPYFLTLFVDLETATPAVRLLVKAIPFSYAFTAAPSLFLGQYAKVWWGIAYEAVWFAVFALAAARVFSSDRILTMRLNLRRRRGARIG